MTIDRKFIKRVSEEKGIKIDDSPSGMSHGDGFRAEFHPNGRLKYFSHHKDGKPSCWFIRLSENEDTGYGERIQVLRYPESADVDTDTDQPETFEKWVERWVSDICEDAESTDRCSFCGAGKDEASVLLSGRNESFICDECIALMADVIRDHLPAGDDSHRTND